MLASGLYTTITHWISTAFLKNWLEREVCCTYCARFLIYWWEIAVSQISNQVQLRSPISADQHQPTLLHPWCSQAPRLRLSESFVNTRIWMRSEVLTWRQYLLDRCHVLYVHMKGWLPTVGPRHTVDCLCCVRGVKAKQRHPWEAMLA